MSRPDNALDTNPTTTRLALAIGASLALHALVISHVRLELAAPQPPEATPLEARLVPAPPRKAEPSRRVAAPTHKPRPRRSAAKPVAPPRPPIRAASTAPPLFVPPELEFGEIPEAEEASIAGAEPASIPDGPVIAEQPVAPVSAHPLPAQGRIEYAVRYGSGDGLPVGKIVHSWKMKNGHYLLASDAESTGLVELFSPQRLRYVSQGTITPHGLRPDTFFITRTRRGKMEAARARFEWDKGQIVYGYANDRKVAALSEGAQDLLTLAYQFVVVPAPGPGRLQVPVTSGKGFENYEIEVLAEEVIDTPIGQLRTLHVRQIPQPGKEHFEIWFAVRYNYLPVRISHYGRNGSYSGEQVVLEIRVEDSKEMASR